MNNENQHMISQDTAVTSVAAAGLDQGYGKGAKRRDCDTLRDLPDPRHCCNIQKPHHYLVSGAYFVLFSILEHRSWQKIITITNDPDAF
jgi:hypothetical protein